MTKPGMGRAAALAVVAAAAWTIAPSCSGSTTVGAPKKDATSSDADPACAACGSLACCGSVCVDTSTDTANCGGCGNTCLPGGAPDCVLGVCGCLGNAGQPCGAATTCCPVGCKNLGADPLNCGGCGVACTPGQTCVNGSCSCGGAICASGTVCCNGKCVDTRTDSNNCGACSNQCVGGSHCDNGACVGGPSTCGGLPCPPGQQCCGNVCCSQCTGGVCFDAADGGYI